MNKLISLIAAFLLIFSLPLSAEEKQYQLSSHILDIQSGIPAQGVRISLHKLDQNKQWVKVDERTTDSNGRVKDFLEKKASEENKGIYKLTFHVKDYFLSHKQDTFYPFIEVVFEIKDDGHYHVPITLSAYGYSTYRGH